MSKIASRKASKLSKLHKRIEEIRSQHIDREILLLDRLISAEALLRRCRVESRESPLSQLIDQYFQQPGERK